MRHFHFHPQMLSRIDAPRLGAAFLASGATYALLSHISQPKAYPRAFYGRVPPQMTAKTARRVLSLPRFPTREQISANAQLLLKANHPDRGGSVYLSQLLTEAVQALEV